MGPQLLLDVLRVHVCTSAHSSPNHTRAAAKRPSPARTYAVDGAVICCPVMPVKSDGGSNSGDGENTSNNKPPKAATAREPLERCIGACMLMLRAMLSAELLRSPINIGITGASAGESASAVTLSPAEAAAAAAASGGALEAATAAYVGRESLSAGGAHDAYGQMPFLEGGFGDVVDLSDTRGSAGAGRGSEDAEGGGRGNSGHGQGGLDAAVVCLQECQSPILQRGLLRVLLGLRDEAAAPLRHELLRCLSFFLAYPITTRPD